MNSKLQYFTKKLLTLSKNEIDFFHKVLSNLLQYSRFQQLKTLGEQYKIPVRQIREIVELSYIYYFNNIINTLDKAGGMAAFNSIVATYEKLPTLTVRTSTVIDLAQYSTPSPAAYIIGEFAGEVETVFDPTAGNGMLFLNVKAKEKYGNEISLYRLKNLNYQGIKTTYFDATKEFKVKVPKIRLNPAVG